MRWRRTLAGLAIILLGMPWSGAEAAGRLALVIGVGAYRHAPPLKNPTADARDLAALLRELGFEVQQSLDADKATLDAAIRSFAKRVAEADVALVFFAGHGLQVAGQNHLVPTDAKLENARELDFETVRLDLILAQMENGRAGKVSILLLDACRDNPLSRNLARSMGVRSDSFARGLAPVQSGAGTFIAFSTAPGQVAYDGEGRNSPFAAALLRRLREPGKGLAALMIDVRRDVMAATYDQQVPWDHSALTADFQFSPASGIITGSIPSSAGDPRREERARRLREELGASPSLPATGSP